MPTLAAASPTTNPDPLSPAARAIWDELSPEERELWGRCVAEAIIAELWAMRKEAETREDREMRPRVCGTERVSGNR